MQALHVEYAKSSRGKCNNPACRRKILKNEVRIGYQVMLDIGKYGVYGMVYRHLCCFTAVQIDQAKQSEALDGIHGLTKLAATDRALVEQMKRGELVGRVDLMGRIGDVNETPAPVSLAPPVPVQYAGEEPERKDEESERSEDDTVTPLPAAPVYASNGAFSAAPITAKKSTGWLVEQVRLRMAEAKEREERIREKQRAKEQRLADIAARKAAREAKWTADEALRAQKARDREAARLKAAAKAKPLSRKVRPKKTGASSCRSDAVATTS